MRFVRKRACSASQCVGFVGIDGAAGRDGAGDGDDRRIFGLEHERQRAAAALAHDDDDAALAGLVLSKAAVARSSCDWPGLRSRRNMRRRLRPRPKRSRRWLPTPSLRGSCEPSRKPSCIGNPGRGSVAGRYGPWRRSRRSRWPGGSRGSGACGWRRSSRDVTLNW